MHRKQAMSGGPSKKMAVCKPGREALPETKPNDSRAVRKCISVVTLPSILLWPPKLPNRVVDLFVQRDADNSDRVTATSQALKRHHALLLMLLCS